MLALKCPVYGAVKSQRESRPALGTSMSNFMPRSRLYDDLPAAQPTTSERASAPADAGLPPPPKMARMSSSRDEAEETSGNALVVLLSKLEHLLMRPPSKAIKALEVLQQCLKELSAETAPLFMPALRAAQARSECMDQPSHRAAVVAVFRKVQGQRADFGESSTVQDELDVWLLRALTHPALFVDDSFKFAAAMKELETAVERTNTLSAEAATLHWTAILEILPTAVAAYKFQWARAPVDTVVARIVDSRHKLSDIHRARFDELGDLIRARKRPNLNPTNKKFQNLT